MENIQNNIPINNIIKYTAVFYEEEPKEHTFGSNDIMFELIYETKNGVLSIFEIGAFGDSTLVGQFWDRRKRGITLSEMLENIEEISQMTYKEFKNKILKIKEEGKTNG